WLRFEPRYAIDSVRYIHVPDKPRGVRALLVSMHLFVSPRHGQKVRQAPGPVRDGASDTTLGGVWLSFNYKRGVKGSAWSVVSQFEVRGQMKLPITRFQGSSHPSLSSIYTKAFELSRWRGGCCGVGVPER